MGLMREVCDDLRFDMNHLERPLAHSVTKVSEKLFV